MTVTKRFLVGVVLTAVVSGLVLAGCTFNNGSEGGRDSDRATASQEISERGGGESGGEHGGGREGGGEHGSGGEGGEGGEEGSGANQLAPDETFDVVRGGARLILGYDAESNSFKGTVENTTNRTLDRVRIEVHLSNGTELGPTTPVDMAPGQVLPITLPSTQASFTGWVAHAEVGGGKGGSGEAAGEHGSASGGSEGGGEHGSRGGEGGGEHGSGGEGGREGRGEGGGEGGSGEINEAAMSSPIIPLDQTWNGVIGGLAISARYDAATKIVHSTVQNTTSQKLCYVQAEPHLKSGTRTVGELGPDKLGDLNPGQQATTSLTIAGEPNLAGVAYDGYVVHMEVFDCAGPGPIPHAGGEGAEGGGREGADGEGHDPGGESSSGESGREGGGESGESGGEEANANQLAPNETFDMVRGGARLVLKYDAPSNSF
ncbi:MAG: hypothetical protein OXK79_13010, partial [Chloroflexota bacterium]|nr:hypothetical protein [Chloroflexota bacterium]